MFNIFVKFNAVMDIILQNIPVYQDFTRKHKPDIKGGNSIYPPYTLFYDVCSAFLHLMNDHKVTLLLDNLFVFGFPVT